MGSESGQGITNRIIAPVSCLIGGISRSRVEEQMEVDYVLHLLSRIKFQDTHELRCRTLLPMDISQHHGPLLE